MVRVMMRRSEMLVLSVKFGRCSPISVHAQGLARLGSGSSIHARARMHAVTWAVLRRMPRTIFRATDRRRSSRLGAAAAPDVPEMDMLHKRRGVCPGMRVRVRACPHMHGPKAHQGDP